jgi:hypothetical protein
MVTKISKIHKIWPPSEKGFWLQEGVEKLKLHLKRKEYNCERVFCETLGKAI